MRSKARLNPPFRAEHSGSFVKPDTLRQDRTASQSGLCGLCSRDRISGKHGKRPRNARHAVAQRAADWRDLERPFGLLATRAVRPRVAQRISFDELAEAHR